MNNAGNYCVAERLKDGTRVMVRAIRHDDGETIRKVFSTLDAESIYTRYFAQKKELSETDIRELIDVDFTRSAALVVTTQGPDGDILVGGGRFISGSDQTAGAELAFVTAAEFRGRGVASLILAHLIRIARETGLSKFEADVLVQNHAMLAVFHKCGLALREKREGGVVHLTLDLP
jgi:GNAT superfamily N-acetyltransferase